ncbi:BRCT domain-containing protein [Clostridium sp. C105KSO13]|uniref:BRCT domain-containing protein n=1 Tax=Clostridium sp. C105KSO13 TaxID=1776045 RepID=UPI00325B692A
MIIPHIEDNLDRGSYQDFTPPTCPCCGAKTRVYSRASSDGRLIETLHCDNPDCESQLLRRFVHFVSKKAMDIRGLSSSTLEKFLANGWVTSFQDLYHLERHKEDILKLDGFGEASYQNLQNSIYESRKTTFVRYLVAMDIPLIGRTISSLLDTVFNGSLEDFETAALSGYDFTAIEGIGPVFSNHIHSWFADEENLRLFRTLQTEMTFEERKENTIMKENIFTGRTIVATGKLEHFTRDEINTKILELGAKPGSSVSKKTDFLIAGEKAGSKLAKAQTLGIRILSEAEFLEMIA